MAADPKRFVVKEKDFCDHCSPGLFRLGNPATPSAKRFLEILRLFEKRQTKRLKEKPTKFHITDPLWICARVDDIRFRVGKSIPDILRNIFPGILYDGSIYFIPVLIYPCGKTFKSPLKKYHAKNYLIASHVNMLMFQFQTGIFHITRYEPFRDQTGGKFPAWFTGRLEKLLSPFVAGKRVIFHTITGPQEDPQDKLCVFHVLFWFWIKVFAPDISSLDCEDYFDRHLPTFIDFINKLSPQ